MKNRSLGPKGADFESQNLLLRRMSRALDYAEGFWLGFAKCNLPPTRIRAIRKCNQLLEPLNVRFIEVDLRERIDELLPILEERMREGLTSFNDQQDETELSFEENPIQAELASDRAIKLALSVSGLEYSISSPEAHPPILSHLNLNRELFRQRVPVPILIWVPDYALTAIARQAPDFWAWRSGLYEFAPKPLRADKILEPTYDQRPAALFNLSQSEKREKLNMLKGLLADYEELGEGTHERFVQLSINIKIGNLHKDLYEKSAAKRSYLKYLDLAKELKAVDQAIDALLRLGLLAFQFRDWSQAEIYFNEALDLCKANQKPIATASVLNHVGKFYLKLGRLNSARDLLNESLAIWRHEKKERMVAATLGLIGRVEQKDQNFAMAKSLYVESLRISTEANYTNGIAFSLFNLGDLAIYMKDLHKSSSYLKRCLQIRRELGDDFGTAICLTGIANIEEELGDYTAAYSLHDESLNIRRKLGDLKGEAYTYHRLGRLDQISGRDGSENFQLALLLRKKIESLSSEA